MFSYIFINDLWTLGGIMRDNNKNCKCEDAVKWNPFNNVVQCHRCGQIFTTKK